VQELLGWLSTGQVIHQEDVQESFENAPRTFFRLFEGKNHGKQLLKIADLPMERN
jgi:NADPH-dependent curcumin reductase CurA